MAQRFIRHEDYMTGYLKDPERARAYLSEVFRDNGEGDQELLICQAMRQVIRAQGFAQVAMKAKIGRESLYKSFGDQGNPRMSTLLRVIRSLGFDISLTVRVPDEDKKSAPGRRVAVTSTKTGNARRGPSTCAPGIPPVQGREERRTGRQARDP